MNNIKDERADRDRTAENINPDVKHIVTQAVYKITDEIRKHLSTRTTPLLVSIDGGSSAGKSTIAILVASQVNAVIIQGDYY